MGAARFRALGALQYERRELYIRTQNTSVQCCKARTGRVRRGRVRRGRYERSAAVLYATIKRRSVHFQIAVKVDAK